VLYGIADVPAWWMCILLGFQTYLTMLGASVLIPLILVPAMGGTTADLAEVICTCFFSSGINTLLQTLLGARLPIVQVSQPALAAAVDTGSTRLETTVRDSAAAFSLMLPPWPPLPLCQLTLPLLPLLPLLLHAGRLLRLYLPCAGHLSQHSKQRHDFPIRSRPFHCEQQGALSEAPAALNLARACFPQAALLRHCFVAAAACVRLQASV
jgi:hypothetical protein